jgi:hypothetical protein
MQEYMCARIKLHTCIDSVNIKTSVNREESIKQLLHDRMSQLTTIRVANNGNRNTRRSPP